MKTQVLCFCLCAVLLLGFAAPLSVKAAASEEEPALSLCKQDALPEAGWQKSAAFPDWKGYTDDTLAMNSMISFLFYHGQGTIWFKVPDEVKSFTLYVNETRFDTSGVTGGIFTADISGVAVDGVNTLQISNILPLGLKKPLRCIFPIRPCFRRPTVWKAFRRSL